MLRFISLLLLCGIIISNQIYSEPIEQAQFTKNRAIPHAIHGILDLSQWDFEKKGKIPLAGEWFFEWGKFIKPAEVAEYFHSFPQTALLPGSWNNYKTGKTNISGHGFATYYLRIKTAYKKSLALSKIHAHTSFTLWINGKEMTTVGIPGKTAENSSPGRISTITSFIAKNNYVDVVLHVSNFSFNAGGLWDTIYIGTQKSIAAHHNLNNFYDIFLFGSLIIMAIYYLGLYFVRKKEKVSLWFGCAAFILSIRILVTNQVVIFNMFPVIPWELVVKLNILTLVLTLPVFLKYIDCIYRPYLFFRILIPVYFVIATVYSIIVIFFPASFYSYLILPYHINVLIAATLLIIALFRASVARAEGAVIILIGSGILTATAINDILMAKYIISSIQLVPLGIFVFIFAQSFNLMKRFAHAFNRVEALYISYSRFVPPEFIGLLDKKSITEVKLGDQVLREMSVMFVDIRDFTRFSEKMSPGDTVNFINGHLGRISPLIRKHRGFIDKYIGDAIMALFPESVDDAVNAGIAIKKMLKQYNLMRKKYNQDEIDIGIGIHRGSLILGTVGEENRMDGTVISDAVNIASRLEGLNKIYGTTLIISEKVFLSLKDKDQYTCRKLEKVKVKGKENSIIVYEICDGDQEESLRIKSETIADFEKALELYDAKEYSKAGSFFSGILKKNPRDKTSEYFLTSCQNNK